jgi:hypothetical protein
MRLMTDMCSYTVDREATLVAYLYDEIDQQARARFDSHLAACAACRDELREMRRVRGHLASWNPPEPNFTVSSRPSFLEAVRSNAESLEAPPGGDVSASGPAPVISFQAYDSQQRPPVVPRDRPSWWREIPAWAQVAAAVLILGVAAGIANLDVRYDANGLTIRTGWSKTAKALPNTSTANGAVGATHAELAALEQQLRTEMRALEASTRGNARGDSQPVRLAADADLMRRTRALVDDAEKRQQRELALRIGEVLRDVNAQRQADLMRIDRSLGLVQNNLGVEVLKQRQQVNYLMRVNQR